MHHFSTCKNEGYQAKSLGFTPVTDLKFLLKVKRFVYPHISQISVSEYLPVRIVLRHGNSFILNIPKICGVEMLFTKKRYIFTAYVKIIC